MTDELDFDDILDEGFTEFTGYSMRNLSDEELDHLANQLVGDVMNRYVEDFRSLIKQGLIDRFKAAIDVHNDNWAFVYRDRGVWPPNVRR